jgi:hypothetical protein
LDVKSTDFEDYISFGEEGDIVFARGFHAQTTLIPFETPASACLDDSPALKA